jgi:hypothetical protein
MLERVPLGDDGFMMVAQGLNNNASLKTLKLIGCNIGDSSIRLLVERWHPKSLLECLLLRNNNIGPEGAQLLFRAAAAHPSMQTIDLSHNTGIGFEGLTFIGEELPLQLHLKDVRVDDCFKVTHYDDAMCPKAQKQAEARKQARHALTNGMKENQSITQLYLEDPFYCASTCWPVRFYAAVNQFGRRLLLSMDHQLAPMVWCHVLAKCQRRREYATSFMYYFLCEQPTLVHRGGRKRRRSMNE